jgi:rhodanese-related sulfurtransferase
LQWISSLLRSVESPPLRDEWMRHAFIAARYERGAANNHSFYGHDESVARRQGADPTIRVMDRFQGRFEADADVADAPAALAPAEVFELACARRTELELDYAGAVTPPEAWLLVQQGVARLVDVRTAPEFKFVGHVPNSKNVEWHGKDPVPRMQFLKALRDTVTPETPVLLICRSGVRSHAAASAAAAAGFERVYNVLDGFEGQIDTVRQRGKVNGWRFAGLPWEQD